LIRAALLLALAACGGSAPPAPLAKPTPQVAVDALAKVEGLAALDGAPVGAIGPEQRGTLVIVFASWCHFCREEIELLDVLRREAPELRIVGLNAYETFDELSDDAELRGYLARKAPWLRTAVGDALLPHFGGVPKIPTLFLFDAEGRLVTDYRRARRPPPSLDELRADVASLPQRSR
jgi:thiol-disulfide isomerase/thioredoxin